MGTRGAIVLVVALAAIAAAFTMRDGGPGPASPPAAEFAGGSVPEAGPLRTEAPTRSGAPVSAAAAAERDPAAASSGLLPPRARGRSPLERSPGYVPPEDPESASVRLGRREAPPVEGDFEGGTGSLEEFCRAVVAALNAGDGRTLHALRITRTEFETLLWREFPQSRPITNITAHDAWELSHASSTAGVSRAIGLHGGRHLRYLRVNHDPRQPFTNFDLVRGIEILTVSETTKELHTLTFVPSVAVRHGRYKALLYHD